MHKWIELAKLISGPILMVVGVPLPVISAIQVGIVEAEEIHGAKSGPEKLAHVQHLALLAAQGTNGAAGHQVVDPATLEEVVAAGVSTVVKALNLVRDETPDEVEAVPVPAAPEPEAAPEEAASDPDPGSALD